MRSARLVGLSPDGRSLIVATDSGEELAIAADDRLRAAMRGDRPRLGQLEIEMESALSPRDIQARIRAGESLEDVAKVAGIPIERVERFAAPVLAERDHVASLAMTSSVRRRGETHAHRNLRVVLTERLLARGVDIDDIRWDSHRLEDGRWGVTADYRSGEANRQAMFVFDLPGRFSVAGNDEARWILGEHSASHGPQPGRRRPADAEEDTEDTEPTLDLSDDLALVRAVQEPVATEPALPDSPSAPESPIETLYGILDVAELPPEVPDSGLPQGLANGWEPAIVVNYPVEPGHLEEEQPGAEPDGTDEPGPPDRPANIEDREDEAHAFEDEHIHPAAKPTEKGTAVEESDATMPPAPVSPQAKPARRKRAPVPSWDEIMFGGPKRPG